MSDSTSTLKKQKIILLGRANSGKSCLLNKLMNNKFTEDSMSTIGVNFGSVSIPATSLTLDVWDTAGGQEYQSIVQYYLRGVQAAIITVAYDWIQHRDYDEVEEYVKSKAHTIRHHKNDGKKTKMSGVPDYTVPILLILTKTDLRDTVDSDKHSTIIHFCDKLVNEQSLWGFVEVSSKTMSKSKLLDVLYPYARHVYIKTINSGKSSSLSKKAKSMLLSPSFTKKCCVLQ